jgi:hypothetical protein
VGSEPNTDTRRAGTLCRSTTPPAAARVPLHAVQGRARPWSRTFPSPGLPHQHHHQRGDKQARHHRHHHRPAEGPRGVRRRRPRRTGPSTTTPVTPSRTSSTGRRHGKVRHSRLLITQGPVRPRDGRWPARPGPSSQSDSIRPRPGPTTPRAQQPTQHRRTAARRTVDNSAVPGQLGTSPARGTPPFRQGARTPPNPRLGSRSATSAYLAPPGTAGEQRRATQDRQQLQESPRTA